MVQQKPQLLRQEPQDLLACQLHVGQMMSELVQKLDAIGIFSSMHFCCLLYALFNTWFCILVNVCKHVR